MSSTEQPDSISSYSNSEPGKSTPAQDLEVRAQVDTKKNRFECRGCGYIYEPDEGIKKFAIEKGTPFLDLDSTKFKCPVCLAKMESFRDIGRRDQASGFEENLTYGFGNTLTAGQKNVLIFGGLALAVACFLSLYSLN